MENKVIRKIWKANKPNGDYTLLVTVPKNKGMEAGDYVVVSKLEL